MVNGTRYVRVRCMWCSLLCMIKEVASSTGTRDTWDTWDTCWWLESREIYYCILYTVLCTTGEKEWRWVQWDPEGLSRLSIKLNPICNIKNQLKEIFLSNSRRRGLMLTIPRPNDKFQSTSARDEMQIMGIMRRDQHEKKKKKNCRGTPNFQRSNGKKRRKEKRCREIVIVKSEIKTSN